MWTIVAVPLIVLLIWALIIRLLMGKPDPMETPPDDWWWEIK